MPAAYTKYMVSLPTAARRAERRGSACGCCGVGSVCGDPPVASACSSACARGSAPVLAPAAGEVTLAEPDLFYSGGTVILDHGYGLSSSFLHLSKVSVSVGDQLQPGDLLGAIGATGRATGPHLDWRMSWFNQRIDPQLLVPPMPD